MACFPLYLGTMVMSVMQTFQMKRIIYSASRGLFTRAIIVHSSDLKWLFSFIFFYFTFICPQPLPFIWVNQIVPVLTYVTKHSAVHYYKPTILGSVKEMVCMDGISIITLHLKINKKWLCFSYILIQNMD